MSAIIGCVRPGSGALLGRRAAQAFASDHTPLLQGGRRYITVFYHRVNPMREIGKLLPILSSQNARVSGDH
jgi:hypothetical protein